MIKFVILLDSLIKNIPEKCGMGTLYHYTNAVGLEGIIRSKSFFMSDFRFMNDPVDIQFGRNAINAYISMAQSVPMGDGSNIVDDFNRAMPLGESGRSVFVGSLTKNGDLLSQWRGYNNGLGFSIGFDEDKIRSLIPSDFGNTDEVMVPVIYPEDGGRWAIEELFSRFPTERKGHFTRFYWSWMKKLIMLSVSIKHHKFQEEEETRIVAIGNLSKKEVGVRAGPRGLRPYWKRSLLIKNENSEDKLPLVEIIVGPGMAPTQIDAVKVLLQTSGETCPVIGSKIPYMAD